MRILVILGAAASAAAAQPRFNVRDVYHPASGVEESWATDLNNRGRVVGGYHATHQNAAWGFVADSTPSGFLVQVIPPAEYPGGTRYVEPLGVNDNGELVGERQVTAIVSTTTRGFVTFDGVIPDVLDPVPGTRKVTLMDLSDEAVPTAVGYRSTGEINSSGDEAFHAVSIFLDGNLNSPLDLGTLGGKCSHANAINAVGHIVGGSLTSAGPMRAFFHDGFSMSDLGTLGGRSSEAHDLNESGLVVGAADRADGLRHAFIWNGVMADLGALSVGSSEARSINEAGQVVGRSWTFSGRVHAFLHDGFVMRDLNDLIPPGSGWELISAEAINDRGEIVGQGLFEGRRRAFMLVPCADCGPRCLADLTGASDPNHPAYGIPDGSLDAADFFYFLDQFVAGNAARVDFTGSSDPSDPNYGDPDGVLDIDDFFYFLDRFVEGCS